MKLLEKMTKKDGADKRRETFAQRCSALTSRLSDIRANFDNVIDPHAIDALIYEENAVLVRLEQLYREARAEGISVEPHERGKIDEF
ncbi:MAG: YaaL family protein [Oscillospiraceae bacterium]|nr:YaaL family protein [Oscillospiraceae bacterium]